MVIIKGSIVTEFKINPVLLNLNVSLLFDDRKIFAISMTPLNFHGFFVWNINLGFNRNNLYKDIMEHQFTVISTHPHHHYHKPDCVHS